MERKEEERVTRAQVAAAAGVSEATVSMALRGLAKVSAGTRERVCAVAARMGYEPDVAASMMAQMRRRGKRDRLRVVMLSEMGYSHEVGVEAFRSLGVEMVWRRPSEFATPEAASRQLWHEGISGLVVSLDRSNWTASEVLRFDWSRFSAVKTNRGLPELRLHVVRHSPFDYMEETIGRVLRAGYRRISVVLMRSSSDRDDDARYGALLNWQARKLPSGATMRWREIPGESVTRIDAATMRWLREEPTDAYVLYHWTMIIPLIEAGMRIPGEVGAAAVLNQDMRVEGIPRVAGCDIRTEEQFTRMAVLLRDLMLRGERGFPAHPGEHVIEPRWIEGETLPVR